jgi:hypothetical protein
MSYLPDPEDDFLSFDTPPETEEDRIVVNFLRTGKDPGRKAGTILAHLWRENKPLSIRIRHALAIVFDPATKPRRLVIKERKVAPTCQPFFVACEVIQEMRNPSPANRDPRGHPIRKRIIGMVGDRYGIGRSSVESFLKQYQEEAEIRLDEEELWDRAAG